jgi:pimeloyl-ACP methyl ester carboxylesterase
MKKCAGLLKLVSAIAGLLFLASCQTVQRPAWELPPGVKTLAVDGYPMAYVERGAGPTVVLVHGSLNDYRYWTPQLESLSSRFRVVSVSLRHYYPEPWNGVGEFSFTRHARDLAALIESLNAGPVYVVGWSRGGNVAVAMTRMRSDLVRKLVLMDPALYELAPAPSDAPKEDPRIARLKATQPFFQKNDIEGGLQYFFDGVNGPGTWSRLSEPLRQGRRENAWTLVGQLGDVETYTCADIGAFRMPVLLMTGERSPRQFAPILDGFQRCLPSAARATVPNAAHQMSQMNPPASDAALVKFLLE